MKNKTLLILLLTATFIFSCKENNPTEQVIEEETIAKVPNNSDAYFMEALSLLEEQKGKEAADYLKKGLIEIKKEGKEIGGLYKVNLEKATLQLTKMANDLESGTSVSEEAVREAIANAEINVAHEYLSTEEIYVLENPEQVISRKTRRHFNRFFKNLKNEEGKMTAETQKEGEALLKEGEMLDKELKEWEEKAKEYTKKANEHFKTNYPKYYVPYY